jgi:hypothetical protein
METMKQMSSKRNLRWRGCSRKVSYCSAADARRAASRAYWATREILRAYHCQFCGHFHVGHPPTNEKRTRANFKTLVVLITIANMMIATNAVAGWLT